MANSTTNLDTISQSQASKEVTANALFDAGSPATLYGRRASTTSGLTWGYYGGYALVRGVLTSIANGTLSLTASTTNYVVAARATGAVSVSTATTNWNDTANYQRLYSIVTGTATVTSYTDYRSHDLSGHAYAGTYTPTLTNVTNLAASTAYSCQYIAVGNVVHVSGRADEDPTAAGLCQLGISLPVASNIANANECAGAASAPGIAGQSAAILGDATNDRATMEWIAVDTTSQAMYFSFMYRIL